MTKRKIQQKETTIDLIRNRDFSRFFINDQIAFAPFISYALVSTNLTTKWKLDDYETLKSEVFQVWAKNKAN